MLNQNSQKLKNKITSWNPQVIYPPVNFSNYFPDYYHCNNIILECLYEYNYLKQEITFRDFYSKSFSSSLPSK